jgi:hypothetical protein
VKLDYPGACQRVSRDETLRLYTEGCIGNRGLLSSVGGRELLCQRADSEKSHQRAQLTNGEGPNSGQPE